MRGGVAFAAFAGCFALIVLAGCGATTTAKPSTTTKAATPTTNVDLAVAEISVAKLQHAHLKPRLSTVRKPTVKNELIAGLSVLPSNRCQSGTTTISSLPSATATDIPLHDQPHSESAYCIASFSSGHDELFDMPGSFATHLSAPTSIADGGEGAWLRADRIEDGGSTFRMLTLWADMAGRMERINELTVPLTKLASFAGTTVYAFIDDDGVATKSTPAAAIVIKRPRLEHWRIGGDATFVTGANAERRSMCGHTWMSVSLEKGNGATTTAFVAVETETGARILRVNVSSMWLASQPHARITTRMQWSGEESDTLNLANRTQTGAPLRRRPFIRDGE